MCAMYTNILHFYFITNYVISNLILTQQMLYHYTHVAIYILGALYIINMRVYTCTFL